MIVETVSRAFRDLPAVSRMNSDSGVVTRMCGGLRRICSRSHMGVSPVRTAVRIGRQEFPVPRRARQFPPAERPDCVECRWKAPSAATRRRPLSPPAAVPCRAARTKRSRQMRNAASVLPDPVGAEISTSRPARISGHPSICGSVACPKRRVNHSEIRGSKSERGVTRILILGRALVARDRAF